MGNKQSGSKKKAKDNKVFDSEQVAEVHEPTEEELFLAYAEKIGICTQDHTNDLSADETALLKLIFNTACRDAEVGILERLTKEDYIKVMKNPKISMEEAELLFDMYCTCHSMDPKRDRFKLNDYIFVMALLMKGSDQEKTDALFVTLDVDRSASLSKAEIKRKVLADIITASIPEGQPYRAHSRQKQAIFDVDAEEVAARIFSELDPENTGEIDRAKFMKGFGPGGLMEGHITALKQRLAQEKADLPGQQEQFDQYLNNAGIPLNDYRSQLTERELQQATNTFEKYATGTPKLIKEETFGKAHDLVTGLAAINVILLFRKYNVKRWMTYETAFDLDDFLFVTALELRGTATEKLDLMFVTLDVDRDGFLTVQELRDYVESLITRCFTFGTPGPAPTDKQYLVNRMLDSELQAMLDLCDTTKRGAISRDEFVAGFTPETGAVIKAHITPLKEERERLKAKLGN